MASVEDLTKTLSSTLTAIAKLKARTEEMQASVGPEIKAGLGEAKALFAALEETAKNVMEKLSDEKSAIDQKCQEVMASISKERGEIDAIVKKLIKQNGQNVNAETDREKQSENKPASKTIECSYTIKNGKVEVKFNGVPSEEIRAELKQHKFGWSKQDCVWRGNADKHPENIELAKRLSTGVGSRNVNPENISSSVDEKSAVAELQQIIKQQTEIIEKLKKDLNAVNNPQPVLSKKDQRETITPVEFARENGLDVDQVVEWLRGVGVIVGDKNKPQPLRSYERIAEDVRKYMKRLKRR